MFTYSLCLLVHNYMFISTLFVCLLLNVPLENFSLIRKRHHYRRRMATKSMVFKQGGILLLSPVIIFVVTCRGTRQFNHLFTKSKDWWEPDLPVIHTHWSFKGRLKFWIFFITALHRQWCMMSPYDLTTDASKRDT